MDIGSYSVAQLATAIQSGKLSVQDCIKHFSNVTESRNDSIGAFVNWSRQDIECDSDTRHDSGTFGPLNGIPIAVKDGICTKGIPTTACSSMLSTFDPPYDATVIQRLRNAGAVIAGKTNMDEFAMGSSTENSCFGATRNPWDSARVPGGSSGGSAAAIAAGMVPLALGSDTGGSIRQPAAFCGITGLKPTYGLVSRYGLIAFASSLDQIGPMGRSAEDVAILLSTIAGHDASDSTSAAVQVPNYVDALDGSLHGLKIGVCQDQLGPDVDSSIVNAVQESLTVFRNLGATVVPIELPHQKYAVATYYVVAPCEASSNLSRYDGVRYTNRSESADLHQMYTQTRSHHFGAEVKRRILLGTYALSSGYYDQYYVKASQVRRLIKQDFEQAFDAVDLIAGPTTPTTAFSLGACTQDPIKMYLADVFTVSANLAGIPAISIPCGFSDGLPIGLQLQGPAFGESTLLRAAHGYQMETEWHQRRPM